MFFSVPRFEGVCYEDLKAAYLSWFRADLLKHCDVFTEPSQKLRCQRLVDNVVGFYGAYVFALDLWITQSFWVIIATVLFMIPALLFPSMRRAALRLIASQVAYVLSAFVHLLKQAQSMASTHVVSRREHDAVVADLQNKLAQQEAQTELLKASLEKANESHDKTNRAYSELNTLACELKQEVKHYKELLGAEKKKNRRNSN
ncbi:hypothetical protein AAVH_14845 [Aphelenchoides avenae]|nr:hypothetical protein AAVH_14843 [Aphelenchus avenae]KAH7717771.1 hypothetical protein AAVH_14845 [Aphelenchus avenae]